MKSLIEQKDSRKLALLEYLATTKTTSVAACCVYLNVSEKGFTIRTDAAYDIYGTMVESTKDRNRKGYDFTY